MAKLLQVRSSTPIQCVCAVERVDENAFQQQNVMQVITQDDDGQLHTMYIQCKVRPHLPLSVSVFSIVSVKRHFVTISKRVALLFI